MARQAATTKSEVNEAANTKTEGAGSDITTTKMDEP